MSEEDQQTETAQEPSMEDILASIRRILSEDAEAESAKEEEAAEPEPEPEPVVELAEPEPEPDIELVDPEPDDGDAGGLGGRRDEPSLRQEPDLHGQRSERQPADGPSGRGDELR